MLKAKDLGLDLATTRCGGRGNHRAGLQFGIRFGHDFVQTIGFDHAE
ncbi:MAG: hypothetical protein RJA29_2819 [Pseudomonadota bacterium]